MCSDVIVGVADNVEHLWYTLTMLCYARIEPLISFISC